MFRKGGDITKDSYCADYAVFELEIVQLPSNNRQSVAAMSSTEAEYIAAADCYKEAYLLGELI